MKKNILLLIILFPVLLFAQKNYSAGQVITKAGEILKGEIDYREWNVNPHQIRFRKGGEVKIYKATELRSFKIDAKNEIYESAVVLYNTEELDWEEMPQFQTYRDIDNAIQMQQDTVFLMVLVRGKMNLYQLIDKKKRLHYYYRKGNGPYEPLIYRIVKIMRPGEILMNDILQENNLPRSIVFEDYKGQLKYAMLDCGNMDSGIDKLTYSRSIMDVVRRYNECAGQLIYLKPKDRASKFLHGFVGRAQSSFEIADANNGAATTLPSTWSTTFGVGIELGIPRSKGKFSWIVEALYMRANSTVTTSEEPLDLGSKDFSYTLDVRGFRFNGLLKYTLLTGNIQPYIKAGLGTSSYTRRDFLVKDLTTIQTRRQSLLKTEPFLIASFGLKAYNVFLEGRYMTGNDINKVTGFDTAMRRVSILLGYSLPL